MTLFARVMLVAFVAAIPAATVQIYAEYKEREAHAAERRAEAVRFAQSVAEDRDALFDGVQRFLAATAEIPAVRRLDPSGCNATFDDLRRHYPFYSTLSAADADGWIVCRSAPESYDRHANVAQNAQFQRTAMRHEFTVCRHARSDAGAAAVLRVAYPIMVDQKSVGVIIAGLSLDHLKQYFRSKAWPPNTTLAVVDAAGTVVAREPDRGELFPAEFVQGVLKAGGSGAIEALGPDGAPRVFGYVSGAGAPGRLSVIVGLDGTRLDGSALQRFLSPLLVSALALALAAVLGNWFIRRPAVRLEQASRHWATGAFDARAALRHDGSELAQVAEAGDRIARELQEHQQRTDLLLREINHRVTNTLQLLSSMLGLQSRHTRHEPTRRQLMLARRRVTSVGLVFRRMSRIDNDGRVDLGALLRELCHELSTALPAGQCSAIDVAAPALDLPGSTALPIVLIAHELVTNSLKYASGSDLRIDVRLSRRDGGDVCLEVADNGPGLPSGFNPTEGAGLGLDIVSRLVWQLRGSLDYAGGGGARFVIIVPSAEAEQGAPVAHLSPRKPL